MMSKNLETKRILLTPCADLQVREDVAEGGARSRTITGYAILFDTPSAPLWSDEKSEAREVIAPEAITREVLDASDIKFTMFHDRQLILARSRNGAGTLSYSVDERGVKFEFEAPNTIDGDKALELVRRGDIAGCSFAFSTYYGDTEFVSRAMEERDGKTMVIYTVRALTGIYDFTLAADPAYPDTSVEARELVDELRKESKPAAMPDREKEIGEQLREMRRAASRKLLKL